VSVTQALLERNAVHVAKHPGKTASLEPTLRALVLTCADHRVDPAQTLGIQLNEAVVLRNAGGRITPEVLHELAVLVTIAAIEELGSGFELILMQHTDCGMARLSGPEHQNLLAGYFGIEPEEVPGRKVADPVAAVQIDVEQLRGNPFMPSTLQVSGLVYDVENGHVAVVAEPAPLGDAR
jgi:carbonic anhydrase